MTLRIAIAAAVVALLAGCAATSSTTPASQQASAVATPLPASSAEMQTNMHVQAIASGNVAKLATEYAPDARLEWIGGPLDGTYRGAQIAEVWAKFTKAQGPRGATSANMETSTNPKGATVSLNGLYRGKADVKVRQVITYRNGLIMNEIWQVDPNLPS